MAAFATLEGSSPHRAPYRSDFMYSMMWGISSSLTPSVAGISPAVKPRVILALGSLMDSVM